MSEQFDAFVFSGARLDQVNNRRGDEEFLSSLLQSEDAVFIIFSQLKPLVIDKGMQWLGWSMYF
jgi:hypothetical protein